MLARARKPFTSGPNRLRRLKLLTAVLLLAALLLGLVLYSWVVSDADARYERSRVDELVERQVATAGRQVRLSADGELVVGFAANRAILGGYPQIYLVEVGDDAGSAPRVVVEPTAPFWHDAPVAAAALAASRQPADTEPTAIDGTGHRVAPYDERQPLRLLARPVVDRDGDVQAVVVGVATTSSGVDRHARLVRFMRWSAGAFVLFGLLVAVLLARGRFWLVDQALQRHEQFLHDTAHELRSPIGTLRTIAEAGLAGDVGQREALERAAHVVETTDHVIDDLMVLTRIETGRETLSLERVRLDLLVEELVEQRADKPPVLVEARPTVAQANPELVRRAIDNLVENAVRHGRAQDPEAEVVVSVDGGRVTVADRGAGVAPPILTHVLERIDGRRLRTGLGLGLAITGWVARVHGGKLAASNRADGGAAFVLELVEDGASRRSPRSWRRGRRRSGR